jgi:uncharacterized membrane-anchored protein YitT (DUF2179 family)
LSKFKENLTRVLLVLLGSFINSIAINAFIIPHKLLSGGVTGIAIIIQYISNIPSGYLILALNIPKFLIGLKMVDRDFIIFSLIGMISLSAFLVLTKDIALKLRVDDILLSAIYGGVVGGTGSGIVFRSRASQGGTDIIAVVLKKIFGINISTLSMAMNGFVVLIGLFINRVELALYTLISMYITSVVLNRVIEGFDRKKLLLIITSKEEEVSQAIMKELGRGVTYFFGEGAYTRENKKIIYCMITLNQMVRTKKIVEDIDPSAFISIIDASEVQGKGFKKPAL